MYIFNPEHDICLANGDPNYIPPASSLRFGEDCARIMEPIVTDGTVGTVDTNSTVGTVSTDSTDTSGISVWGWDTRVRQKLLRAGTDPSVLPSDRQLEEIRTLSHRSTAAKALKHILGTCRCTGHLTCSIPEELTDTAQVRSFILANGDCVLKAPWSGSGKGLRWVSPRSFSSSDEGWCRNIIRAQGSLMAEKRKDIVLDLAMLMRISGGKVIPQGLSLFTTGNGAYRSNLLASDGLIALTAAQYIPEEVLPEVREKLLCYLQEEFSGRYEGYLGVDMFICREQGRYLLNPCVEINVRMTMGLAARKFADNTFLREDPSRDGQWRLQVISAGSTRQLQELLRPALMTLTPVIPGTTRYAIGIFKA